MPTCKMTISYDGSNFCGFAKQDNAPSVQAEIERVLRILLRRDNKSNFDIVCAGRTDAGVHAKGQVINFEANELINLKSFNGLVADCIKAVDVCVAPDGFSARFDAKMREYRYFISANDDHAQLFSSGFCWDLGTKKLDIKAMNTAASALIGEHDFRSFCKAESAADDVSTMRFIESIKVFETKNLWEDNLVCVQVRGNAFLHNMVRIIVGTLVQVGLGKKDESWVADVMQARDRRAAGQTAPACGLFFWQVEY